MGPPFCKNNVFPTLSKARALKNDPENLAMKQLPSLHLFLGDSSLYRFWALCLALVDLVDFLTWNSNFLCTLVSISIRWGIKPLWKWNVNKSCDTYDFVKINESFQTVKLSWKMNINISCKRSRLKNLDFQLPDFYKFPVRVKDPSWSGGKVGANTNDITKY